MSDKTDLLMGAWRLGVKDKKAFKENSNPYDVTKERELWHQYNLGYNLAQYGNEATLGNEMKMEEAMEAKARAEAEKEPQRKPKAITRRTASAMANRLEAEGYTIDDFQFTKTGNVFRLSICGSRTGMFDGPLPKL